MEKILVVEDSLDLLDCYQQGLKDANFDLDTATNGKDALKLTKKNQYALIVSDLKMPKKDGYDFIYQLRKKGPNVETPIIVVSGFIDEDSISGLSGSQSIYFMNKPIELDALISNINNILKK